MLTPLELNANIPDPPKPKEVNSEDEEQPTPFQNMEVEESASDFSVNSSNSQDKASDKLSKIAEEKELSHSERSERDYPVSPSKPKDLYIHGLFIEGGQWDYTKECLIEPKLRVLNYVMPAFKLDVISKEEYKAKFDNDKYFNTPLYKISLREALHLDGECFIMDVPLKILEGTTPKFWLKRSTALFCQMNL